MTEAEWLTETDGRQWATIEGCASVRKMRLIAAAYVRRANPWRPKDEVKQCDDLIEAIADHPRPWANVMEELEGRPGESWVFTHILAQHDLAYVAGKLRRLLAFYPVDPPHHYGLELLLEVVGNPFRPVNYDPSWRTPTVLALAQGIYEEGAFDRMPILADALQDGGCDNIDILDHCRGPGPHVRGCWVVDLLLGKA